MENPIERIIITQTAKEQLVKLKRSTKIEQWNILCRWALCRSLAEPSIPSPVSLGKNSNVEMTWNIFAGNMSDIFLIALKERCDRDNLGNDKETLRQQFRLHLHRGIGYLSGETELREIEDLITIVLDKSKFNKPIKLDS
jgi:DNA sulfur modification protein DndE